MSDVLVDTSSKHGPGAPDRGPRLALRLDSLIEPSSARDPDEAIAMLAQAPTPDAILLDYRMPGMSGVELLSKIRQISACSTVPVIFLSAMADRGTRQEAVDAGAAGFLIKPFDPLHLAGAVRALLDE